jgi:hypothetical protein
MLCVVWIGRTCMIFHPMRTDARFCILTPLRKDDRLLVWCLFSMIWVEEWTHQACCPFSIWLHPDIQLTVPSFCVLISIERTIDFMDQCRVQCDSLLRSVWFRCDPGSVFESSEADFVDISNSSPIFREHCALPCFCALS